MIYRHYNIKPYHEVCVCVYCTCVTVCERVRVSIYKTKTKNSNRKREFKYQMCVALTDMGPTRERKRVPIYMHIYNSPHI